MIITLNSNSLSPLLYLEENSTQVLRPAAFQKGGKKPENFFSIGPKVIPSKVSIVPPLAFGESAEGPILFEVRTTVGLVEVTLEDGTTILVPAGDKFNPGISRLSQPLSQDEIDTISPEFQGTPLDVAKGRLLELRILAWGQSNLFPELKKDKYIEFNVDMLPEFDPNIDSPERDFVEGILNRAADKLLEHKIDKRFARMDRKIYIDFVSRKSDSVKRDAVTTLFNRLRIVNDHKLYEQLRSAPEDVALSDKLIITYQGDPVQLKYRALILEKTAMSEKEVRVYPWDALFSLSDAILLYADTKEMELYNAIKELFEVLRKSEITKDLLDKFLSNSPAEFINAAGHLLLPPVQELDLDDIEELNRIQEEIEKWA